MKSIQSQDQSWSNLVHIILILSRLVSVFLSFHFYRWPVLKSWGGLLSRASFEAQLVFCLQRINSGTQGFTEVRTSETSCPVLPTYAVGYFDAPLGFPGLQRELREAEVLGHLDRGRRVLRLFQPPIHHILLRVAVCGRARQSTKPTQQSKYTNQLQQHIS